MIEALPRSGFLWLPLLCMACTMFAGCQTAHVPASKPNVNLIDPAIPQAISGQEGWAYYRSASADFDGDGTAERAVVIANVGQTTDGGLLWDDANIWQVYVEEPDGRRTYAYSGWVQLGRLEMTITNPEPHEPPEITILERTPHQLRVIGIRYDGPGLVSMQLLLTRSVNPNAGYEGNVE